MKATLPFLFAIICCLLGRSMAAFVVESAPAVVVAATPAVTRYRTTPLVLSSLAAPHSRTPQQQQHSHQRRWMMMMMLRANNNNNNKEDDWYDDDDDATASDQQPSLVLRLLQPAALLGDKGPAVLFLPLLLGPFLLLPPPTAVLLVLLFGALRTLAVQLVLFPTTLDEDVYGIDTTGEEETEARRMEVVQVDAVCYILAGFSAGIFAPNDWDSSMVLLGVPVLGTVAALLLGPTVQDITQEEQLTKEEKLMNRWDQKIDDDDDDDDSSES